MDITAVITETVETLLREGDSWKLRWASCPTALADDYGNTVSITDDGESVRVDFEYADSMTLVEVLHLDPSCGARRIARVVSALAAAPE